MSDKSGFDDEIAAFSRHWDAGEPTLLNALTNCITIGDLLIADGEVLTNIEVKRAPGRSRREQTAQRGRLLRQINEEPVVHLPTGQVRIIETDIPFVSLWSGADGPIQQALDEGVSGWVPTAGVAVMFMSWPRLHAIGGEAAERAINAGRAGVGRAIGYDRDRVPLSSSDLPYRAVPMAAINVAPMSIYPIKPEHAAALITGRVVFVTEIFIDRIAYELRAQGLAVENLVEGTPAGELPHTILRATSGSTRLSIHRNVLQQLAYELIDPNAWARAYASTLTTSGPRRRWDVHVCLANEGAVWR